MQDLTQSITEAEAAIAEQNQAISALRIEKIGTVFTIHLRLNWRKDEVFMSTTRDKKTPREFKHSGRLIEYIEAKFPSQKTVTMSFISE